MARRVGISSLHNSESLSDPHRRALQECIVENKKEMYLPGGVGDGVKIAGDGVFLRVADVAIESVSARFKLTAEPTCGDPPATASAATSRASGGGAGGAAAPRGARLTLDLHGTSSASRGFELDVFCGRLLVVGEGASGAVPSLNVRRARVRAEVRAS